MWEFLEKMDKNLLYSYAQVISGEKKQLQASKSSKADITEADEIKMAEKSRNRAYYLIWFVYRYVLKCKTLNETKPYANEETLKKYHLNSYIIHNCLYIGINKEICFRKAEDIIIILEILYNRYGFFEQMECFIRNTKNVRQNRCKQVKKKYEEMFEKIKGNDNCEI